MALNQSWISFQLFYGIQKILIVKNSYCHLLTHDLLDGTQVFR